jgi:hypothetical protein
MRAWPVDVDHRDSYPLKISADADLEGGWLAVGLYDARNGRRLPVVEDGESVGDFVRIALDSDTGVGR